MKSNLFYQSSAMELLQEIKKEVEKKINLNPTKTDNIDKIIISLLKEKNITNLNDQKIKCEFILLYTALYFNNIKLYYRIKEENINLGIYPNNLSLSLLDSTITSHLEEDQYIELIKYFKPLLTIFYISTKDLSLIDKNTYIDRMLYILEKRKKTIQEIIYESPVKIYNIFNKLCLDTFTNETYLKASKEQLINVINSLNTELNSDTKNRLNNLIQNTSFANYYRNPNFMFSLFNDKELMDKTYEVENFLTKIPKENLQRVLYLYKQNPNIIKKPNLLNHSILDNYSNEEILYISYQIGINQDEKELKTILRKRTILKKLKLLLKKEY